MYSYGIFTPLLVRIKSYVIWLLIVQQLAIHINQNAESLRHLFVTHSGKELIDIRADDFIKGQLND